MTSKPNDWMLGELDNRRKDIDGDFATNISEDGAPDWRFHVTPWETEFLQRVQLAKQKIRIICPYIKLRNIRLVLAAVAPAPGRQIYIEILTRMNVRDCRSHVHDISALWLLLNNPTPQTCTIDVRIDNRVHAKLYIFDDTEVIVTSSNLTFAGFNRNLEVGLSTSLSKTVRTSISHFESLFLNAAPLTSELLEVVSQAVQSLPPEPFEVIESASEITSTERSAPNVVQQVQLNSTAIEQVEAAIESRLEREIESRVITLPDVDTQAPDVRALIESRFYEELQSRYLALFGSPIPTENELAAIHSHASAYSAASIYLPDRKRADALTEIGKSAYSAFLAISLARTSLVTSTGADLSTKVDFIGKSNHLERMLNEYGLIRVIVGRGVHLASDSARRGTQRISRQVAFRIVGHVYEKCTFIELEKRLHAIVRIEEEFPFENYRDQNYKSVLQQMSQVLYDSVPRYEVAKTEGPDDDKQFTVAVFTGRKGNKFLAEGIGPSKKEAEVEAARKACSVLSNNVGVLLSIHGETVEIPSWLVTSCKTTGLDLIKRLTGKELSEKFLLAALLPFGHHNIEISALRSRIAVVGARARTLIAFSEILPHVASGADATRVISQINQNSVVVSRALESPIGKWLKFISTENFCRNATSTQPVVDTVNAILGAICIEHEISACSQFFKLVVRMHRSLRPRI